VSRVSFGSEDEVCVERKDQMRLYIEMFGRKTTALVELRPEARVPQINHQSAGEFPQGVSSFYFWELGHCKNGNEAC